MWQESIGILVQKRCLWNSMYCLVNIHKRWLINLFTLLTHTKPKSHFWQHFQYLVSASKPIKTTTTNNDGHEFKLKPNKKYLSFSYCATKSYTAIVFYMKRTSQNVRAFHTREHHIWMQTFQVSVYPKKKKNCVAYTTSCAIPTLPVFTVRHYILLTQCYYTTPNIAALLRFITSSFVPPHDICNGWVSLYVFLTVSVCIHSPQANVIQTKTSLTHMLGDIILRS